ncbi:hypothetical protein SDC9_142109 [bioreactor metagenome]|uniref:Uncharacterized protein n=1 Tax=bioreactor metagenome TaxID=1076179 RepID=A0A645DZK7_9ZZZZ
MTTAAPDPNRMARRCCSGGSVRAASAMTTALSPESKMLMPMTSNRPIQKAELESMSMTESRPARRRVQASEMSIAQQRFSNAHKDRLIVFLWPHAVAAKQKGKVPVTETLPLTLPSAPNRAKISEKACRNCGSGIRRWLRSWIRFWNSHTCPRPPPEAHRPLRPHSAARGARPHSRAGCCR